MPVHDERTDHPLRRLPPSADHLFAVTLDDAEGRPETPVVLLHGLGGTHRYWTAGAGATHVPRGATLVDLYGFGQSPRPFRRYTLEGHLAMLESVMNTRGPSILVGHSLGAALAVAYAARHPEMVKGLVLVSLPAYQDTDHAKAWLRQRPTGWFLTNIVATAITCVLTRRLFRPMLPYLIRDVPPEVARDLVEHNLMSSTTSLWNVLYRRDVGADVGSLAPGLPVAFVHGTDDTTAPVEAVRELAVLRPEWQLDELEAVGHHPWLTAPSVVSSVIAQAS